MPILAPELSLYPADLFDRADAAMDADAHWWALYSLPRQEKQLMRRLHAQETPFYAPIVAKRSRAPSGAYASRTFPCSAVTSSCTAPAHSGTPR